MIKVRIRSNDGYADISFPCSDGIICSRLTEIHTDGSSYTTAFVSEVIETMKILN